LNYNIIKKGYPMKNTIINKKLLAEKKKNGCEDCGFNAHPAALALDHIDPRTKHVTRTGRKQNPGAMLSYNPETFKAELLKCRVLCHNCHAIHTFMQNKARRQSGERLSRGANRVTKMSDPCVIV
jgi:hypothetical protein